MTASTWADLGIEIPYGASGQIRVTCPQCTPYRKPGNQRRRDLAVNTQEIAQNHGDFGILEATKYANASGGGGTPRRLAPKGLASMQDQSTPATTEDTTESLPRTRTEALAVGAKRYFTGKPCKNGHIAPRYVANFHCAECLRLENRAFHEANRERENERCREYARRDPEGNRRRSSKWFRENREQVLAYHRERHAANPDRRRREAMEWYRANPDKVHAQRKTRRARVKGASGHVTAAEWEAIKARYGHRCLCCGRADAPLTQDHVIPLVKGGTHTADNIQPLCGTCNRRKYTRTIDYRKQVPV